MNYTKANVLITDANGAIIQTADIGRNNGLLELPTKSWPNGFYTVRLVVDGIDFGSEKLIVNH
jgi:hypothetical protein